MRDIDRFDEHANLNEPSEQDILRARKKKLKFKQAVRFLIKNFLYHAVTLILFSLFVKRMIEAEVYNETGLERGVLIGFALLATVIHILITGLEVSGDGERRRAFNKLLDGRPFTPDLPLRIEGPELIVIGICHLAFQLPFALFHHLLGFFYPAPTIIEKFYCMDAGWMEMVHFGILGALLHTLVFIMGTTVLRYLVYLRWKKEKI
jgi:hypothetical protein